MKKKPMTTAELFDKIIAIMKENGSDFSKMDYASATSYPVPITTEEFSVRVGLMYGGCEGAYFDASIERSTKNGCVSNPLGYVKTLYTDLESLHCLSALMAEFLYYSGKYCNSHLDDFTWEGYDVYAYNEDDAKLCGFTCSSIEAAEKRKNALLESKEHKYAYIVVRDNSTRNEKVYKEEK